MPIRDPNLPHQVILEVHRNDIVVSCNCRRVQSGTRYHYEPMSIVHNRYDTQTIYNNPIMHKNPATAPFGPQWEIRYRDVEPALQRVSVNGRGHRWNDTCWICGERGDHTGVPHGVATGDGLTRHDIVDFMKQGGYEWLAEV